MIQSTIHKMARSIGYEIGLANNESLSDLLNGIGSGLYESNIDNEKYKSRIMDIYSDLGGLSIKMIRELYEIIQIKEDVESSLDNIKKLKIKNNE